VLPVDIMTLSARQARPLSVTQLSTALVIAVPAIVSRKYSMIYVEMCRRTGQRQRVHASTYSFTLSLLPNGIWLLPCLRHITYNLDFRLFAIVDHRHTIHTTKKLSITSIIRDFRMVITLILYCIFTRAHIDCTLSFYQNLRSLRI